MKQWQTIAIEAIRKEMLVLISDQKSALIKAGPGKDKDIVEVVDELHNQISLRIDSIKEIESL
tara:strand:+ start:1533 stop:1721 length:189 start_codon:yes stop_codon:yes gene_type:complete